MLAALLQIVLWDVFMAALMLWPAGTLAYPGGWVFIAMFVLGGGAITIWMARYSPQLMHERLSSPVQREQKSWDRVFLSLFILLFLCWLPLMSWDARRTGFTAVPGWLQTVGGLCLLLYGLGAWWAFRENAYAAPVVKVGGDQHLIDTGPYARVRHPMYGSALLLFIGLPLLLGSWFGLVGGVVFIAAIAWRAVHEEEVLRDELPGYADYMARVRYRLIPGVW